MIPLHNLIGAIDLIAAMGSVKKKEPRSDAEKQPSARFSSDAPLGEKRNKINPFFLFSRSLQNIHNGPITANLFARMSKLLARFAFDWTER